MELPPKTVEVIVQHMQERFSEARSINGEKMLEYPKPFPGVEAPVPHASITLKSLLNRVQPIKGFVYEWVNYCPEQPDTIEVVVEPRRGC